MKKLNAIDFRFFIGCPCNIKGYNDQTIASATISGVNSSLDRVIACVVGIGTLALGHHPSEIKPILRRFETLSRHEVEELNKLWPKENIERTTFGSIQLDADIINYLTSLHVDVFGWIDQGLAIDASYNTIESNNSTSSKENSWDEIEQEYIKEHPAFSAPYPEFKTWLRENYNAPTRK